MALTMTPVTELDAINMMLMSIGQSPVNSVDATGIKDVAIAQLWLHNTSREIQNQKWAFNTDYAYELTPDGNDRYLVPTNCLYIDPTNLDDDWVQRYDEANAAMSLYDLKNQTFAANGETMDVDITWFYAFEKTPNSFRNYVALLAGQRFQAGAISSELLFRFEQSDIDRAKAIFMREQSLVKDRNILQGAGFANQIFHRRRNP